MLYLRLKFVQGGPLGNYEKLKGDLWEILKFFNEIFEQCHSAQKCERGDPLGFFEIRVAKYRNKRSGDPLVVSKKLW